MCLHSKILFTELVLFINIFRITLAGEAKENQTLFNLAETPFINTGQYTVFVSYSFNQGPPALLVDQWQLPDQNSIIFNECGAGLSFGNRFSIIYKIITGKKVEFNESHIGKKTTLTINYFGLKYKIYQSENYYPDYALGINNHYNKDPITIDLMLGSMHAKFKYYANIAIGFLYILPIPYKYTVGISYELFNDFDIFLEYYPENENNNKFSTILGGIKYTLLSRIDIHCSLFYFDFEFNNAIPFRDGLVWQNPLYIITVPKKDQYYFFSLRISFTLKKNI